MLYTFFAYNKPKLSLQRFLITNWKNSFYTPPSSIPYSPTNLTFKNYFKKYIIKGLILSNFFLNLNLV